MADKYLFIFAGAIFFGIGVIVWIFLQKDSRTAVEKIPTTLKTPDPALNLLNRIGLDQDGKPQSSILTESSTVTAKNFFLKTPPLSPGPKDNPTAPLEQTPTLEDDSIQISSDPELIVKCEKLEISLKEKNDELENIQKELALEVKARKDFNKIKDQLEKDIKGVKDANHKAQLELSASQAETANYKTHSAKLDEKLKTRDAAIKQNEKDIDDLVKRLQTFASATPAQSQPLKELPQKPEELKIEPSQQTPLKPEETQLSKNFKPETKTEPESPAPKPEIKPESTSDTA